METQDALAEDIRGAEENAGVYVWKIIALTQGIVIGRVIYESTWCHHAQIPAIITIK